MLIVIGARTDYVICVTERSRRLHHDDAYRRGCHPLDVPSGAAKGGGKMTNRNNDPNHVVVDLDLRSMEDKGSRMKKAEKPRICDILDVEVGERFGFDYLHKNYDACCVDAEGNVIEMWNTWKVHKVESGAVCWIVNHPDCIIRYKPRFDARDVDDAQNTLRSFPTASVAQRSADGHLIISDKDRNVIAVCEPEERVLPSLQPGRSVFLRDIIEETTP